MHERLNQLEENVAELVLFKKKHSLEELKKTKTVGWALRYETICLAPFFAFKP